MEGSFLLITFYFLNKNLIVTIPREEHTYLCINGLSHFTPFIILISKQSNNMMTWVFIAIAFNINKFHVNMLISSSDTRAFSPHILKFYLMIFATHTKQVIVAIILGLKFGNNTELSKGFSILVVVVICLFVAAFGWSWGPLGWTVPSEIFPLETRSAGQGITVAVNLFFTFVIAQSFLSLLCAFKFGIFLFFAGWITVMTLFVYLFLPETKGVPIEEMILLWRKHWFWKRVMPKNQEVDETQGAETVNGCL